MLNFQILKTKQSPIIHTGKQSTPVKNSGGLSLKTLNEDQFIKTISFNGKKKKQKQIQKCDSLTSSISNNEITRRMLIAEARLEGDVNKYYNLINKEVENEIYDFCSYVEYKCLHDHKVSMKIPHEITGVDFVKVLYDCIDLFAKLDMPLPGEINANFEDLSPSVTPDTTIIKAGNYKIYYNTKENKIISSSIHINKHLFANKSPENINKLLNSIFNTFYHEMGHHLHASNSYKLFGKGLEYILNPEDKRIFDLFNSKIKHYAILKQDSDYDCFCTDKDHDNNNPLHLQMRYNITNFERNWSYFLKILEQSRLDSNDIQNRFFPEDFITSLKPVMEKMINAINIIKANLPDNKYALCNPSETIAEASKEELNGHWLDKSFRELLYKLGKPKAPNMCYLDEH